MIGSVRRLPVGTRLRAVRATVVAVVLVLVAPVTVAAPAQAAVIELTCDVNVHLSFSPALTATQTTADVVAVATVVNCLSPSGNHNDLQAGSVSDATGTITSLGGVPCNLLATITGSATIDWSPTGEHTTFDFTVNTNPLNGLIALQTTQTSGPLNGTTSLTVAAANPNLGCALGGLSSLTVPIGQTTFLGT
ncbi:hypothetical protein V5P93_003816 [Actinokineospora auranticolor]|uniref:Ig-like domain-containing protein n=1 Tax=Actinokineospora auranticolor TaxID=155976 RepID=A0A2S6GLQ5_9PSEU|nr:hypothetical protein [Actinokineospora auranticolor]PPK66103.1 hypothetical protein CLV40_11167 [Actinokineospora auranticolor]